MRTMPMCLGAIYWVHIKEVFYGSSRKDAAEIEFDDQLIYDEINKDMKDRKITFKQIITARAKEIFRL